MAEQLKAGCRIRVVLQDRVHVLARGSAWRALGVVRNEFGNVVATLEVEHERRSAVKIADGNGTCTWQVYLRVNEVNALAGRAEAALARHSLLRRRSL